MKFRNWGSVATWLTAVGSLLVATAALHQASSTGKQVEALERQTMIAHLTASAEMLGSDVIAVRIAGIQALEHLARSQPDQFHLRVMRLLCAFMREPVVTAVPRGRRLRADVQAALYAVIYRSERGRTLEARYRQANKERRRAQLEPMGTSILDLTGSDLQWAKLPKAKLGHSILDYANLSHTSGNGADFVGASLVGTIAHKATFIAAKFDNANMLGGNWADSVLQNSSFIHTTMPSILIASHLEGANLTQSRLGAIDLSNTRLDHADLSGAAFRTATRVSTDVRSGVGTSIKIYPQLTQKALDAAIADPNNPPKLPAGAEDTMTGRDLVWKTEARGRAWKKQRALMNESQ